jgi:ABC-type glycerol-3-phosphate transport system substrate-binding protein
MYKKILAGFLFFLFPFYFLLLSGCASQKIEEEKSKITEITVWAFSWTKDALEKIKGDFEKENPNIKVNVELVNYGDLRTKLQAAISSGHAVPDVAALSSAWVGGIISSGGLEDLDKYYKGDNEYTGKFLPEALQIYNYKEKQYGIPLDIDMMSFFYRSDIIEPALKSLGMKEFPKTWVDFVKLCKAVTVDKDNDGKIDQYALPLSGGDIYTLYTGFVIPSGGNYLNADLTKPAFNSPEFKTALQFYMDLIQKEKVAALWTASFGDIVSALKSGFIVMYPIGPWYKEEMKANMPEMKGKWKIAKMPTPTGKGPYTAITGLCLGMPYNAPHKDAAWKYIRYFTSNKKALLTYFDAVGSVIPIKELWKEKNFAKVDEYFNQPIYKEIIAAISDSKPIQIIPQQKVVDILAQAMEKSVRGEGEMNKLLDDAAKEAEEFLK